jgi:pilus assembly protein CpaB
VLPTVTSEVVVASKRTLILIVAVVIGALSAYSLWSYVNGIEDRAFEDAKRVEVYVVAADIPARTSGEQAQAADLIVVSAIPSEFRPVTAVTDLATILGKQARTDLVEGQVLVDGMFVNPVEAGGSSWSEQLEVNEVACAAQFDQVRAVGGLLTPGDRVTMLIVETEDAAAADTGPVDPEAPTTTTTLPEGEVAAPGVGTAQWLYQNVEILAKGNTGVVEAQAADGVVADSGVLTFKAPPEACARITLARDLVYLFLEPQNFLASEFAPISAENILDKPLTPSPSTTVPAPGATTVPASNGVSAPATPTTVG